MQKNTLAFTIGAIVLLLVGYGLFGLLAEKSVEEAEIALEQTADGEAEVSASAVENGSYAVDVAASTMTWSGSKTLIENYVDSGAMKMKEGTVVVDGGNVTKADFVFDMTSIQATTMAKGGGQDALSSHLKSDDFFAVETYPTAVFALASAIPDADVSTSYKYTLNGALTIKGITKDVSFPAVMYMKDGKFIAEATTRLDRTNWDVRFGSDNFFDNLGDNVIDDMFTIAFTVIATR